MIPPKLKVARFTSSLWQPFDLNEIGLTWKMICWSKLFYREHALACQQPVLEHVVVLRLSPLLRCLRNVVWKKALGGGDRNDTSWKPICTFPAPSHILWQPTLLELIGLLQHWDESGHTHLLWTLKHCFPPLPLSHCHHSYMLLTFCNCSVTIAMWDVRYSRCTD